MPRDSEANVVERGTSDGSTPNGSEASVESRWLSTRRWTGVVDRVANRYTYLVGITPKRVDPNDLSEGGTVTVSTATYAVIKIKQSDPGASTTIQDGTEMTVVIEEGRIDEVAAVEIKRGRKWSTSETVLPFELVGFLTRVTSVLAAGDIPVFALSAYSTDHVLVREGDMAATTTKLGSLGGAVKRAENSSGGNQHRSRLASGQFDTFGGATLAMMVPGYDDSFPLVTDPSETDHAHAARVRADPRPGPDLDPVTAHNRGGSRSDIAGAYGDA